jgi:hypothetical protein
VLGSEQMETHDEAGVDLTLIRWFMSLSLAERFDFLEGSLDFAMEVWKRNGIDPLSTDPAEVR